MATPSSKNYNQIAETIPESKRGNVNMELWHPSPLFWIDMPNAKEQNIQLAKDVYAWREQDQKGIVRSNSERVDSWHSTIDMHKRPEFFKLKDFIQISIVKSIEKFFCNEIPFNIRIDSMWANINPKGGYNKSHTHPGAIFSGVYYIQSPDDCGEIILEDPLPQRAWCDMNTALKPDNNLLPDGKNYWDMIPKWTKTNVAFNPYPGRLLIFPSYYPHHVEPNKNENDRISVSFNAQFSYDKVRHAEMSPKWKTQGWKKVGSNTGFIEKKSNYKFKPGFKPKLISKQNQVKQPTIWKLPGT
jgi:uncharacterized protein (TIGR02466 family)